MKCAGCGGNMMNGACPSCSKKSMGKMMMDSGKKQSSGPMKKGMPAGMKYGKK